MKPLIKKIIITLVIVALVYFAYSMFFKKSEDDGALISGTNGLSSTRNLAETQILGNQITQALIQIESLSLDKSVFSNPIFGSLVDRSEIISPEPIGRKNPFASLSDTTVNFQNDLPTIETVSDDPEETTETTEEVTNTTPESGLGDSGL